MKRPGILGLESWITAADIDRLLDAICLTATTTLPWFRLRPLLDDPNDDLYVECALAGGATTIVTNDLGFRHPLLPILGIEVSSARDFLLEERKKK